MARSLGMTGRGLRLGIGRPGAALVVPTPPAQPMLGTDAGDVIVNESGHSIAAEQA